MSLSLSQTAWRLLPRKTTAAKALWGTYAAHLRNMIKGVTEGYTRVLEIEGVGYRAEVKGTNLSLSVGFHTQYYSQSQQALLPWSKRV